jgi:Holliday junction DNA helicase RuvA
MIRILEGVVIPHTPSSITILTSSGIGYSVAICLTDNIPSHESIRLYTHLAVRETALDLYGFSTPELLTFFELLITIPKIGPKSALQILDHASPSLIVEAVTLGDATHLTKLAGLGKKTAEKIVSELKGKLDHLPTPHIVTSSQPTHYQDAFDTLVTLGYHPSEVRTVLDSITDSTTTSDLVKQALKTLH